MEEFRKFTEYVQIYKYTGSFAVLWANVCPVNGKLLKNINSNVEE